VPNGRQRQRSKNKAGGVTVVPGIAKLRQAISVRAVARAAGVGVRLPVGDTLDTLLPTAIYIALVSLLDEFLLQRIGAKYPGTGRKDLWAKISFLDARTNSKTRRYCISSERSETTAPTSPTSSHHGLK